MKKKVLVLGLAMVMLVGTLTIGGNMLRKTDPPFGLEITDIKTL